MAEEHVRFEIPISNFFPRQPGKGFAIAQYEIFRQETLKMRNQVLNQHILLFDVDKMFILRNYASTLLVANEFNRANVVRSLKLLENGLAKSRRCEPRS